MVLGEEDIFKYFEWKEKEMSEERQKKILLPTVVGAIFLEIVMLTVFLIDNYSAEIISLFKQLLFISCFLVASYIVGFVILKIFRKWKGKFLKFWNMLGLVGQKTEKNGEKTD